MSNEHDNFNNKWRNKKIFTEDEAREFWGDARAEARRGECDFGRIYFPEDPATRGFRGIEFNRDANFIFTEFGGFVNFENAKFSGSAKFWNAEFGGYANFWHAKFVGVADFFVAKFGGVAMFRDADLDGGAMFASAEFDGVAEFYKAKFGGDADFLRAEFGGKASFVEAKFRKDANFNEAKFERNANFRGCRFRQKVTMDFAVSRGAFVIDLPHKKGRLRLPFALLGQGYDAYRMAKQFAANLGDYSKAGEYHYAEQSTRSMEKLVSSWQPLCSFKKAMLIVWRRKLLLLRRKATWVALADKLRRKPTWVAVGKKLQRFFPWAWITFRNKLPGLSHKATWVAVGKKLKDVGKFLWELTKLIFSNWLFGYGEHPERPAIAGVLVIFGWTWGYCIWGIEAVGKAVESGITHSFWECLYFSVVTFTTLGYGDMRAIGGVRVLAASEAILGAFLMALFVVAMARKFTR